MIVPQRRAELEEFAPELRPVESDDDLRRKHEFFLRSRGELGRVPREKHADGEAGAQDHQTRRHLRSFVQPQRGQPQQQDEP
jgi:hypothetical protein